MRNIASKIIKERINLVWVNKTIYQLDQLFWNNLEWWTRIVVIYAQPSARSSARS